MATRAISWQCGSRKTHNKRTTEVPKHPKSDQRYWEERVFLPTFTREGKFYRSPHYAAQIQMHGRRKTFGLETANKRNAAALARDIYQSLATVGWEATLAKYRPENKKADLTVGEYVEAVRLRANLNPRTFRDYQRALYRIAVGVSKVPSDLSRFSREGSARWRERVGRTKLEALTDEAIHKWKLQFLRQRDDSPTELAKARVTLNTILRNARSLFAETVLEHMSDLELPDPVPLRRVRMEKEKSQLYRSGFSVEMLLARAASELGEASAETQTLKLKPGQYRESYLRRLREEKASSKREAFKVLLLGLAVGLRRNEIDKLQWSQVNFEQGVIRIEATDCFEPKADSAGDVPVEASVVELLQTDMSNSTSRFVIAGPEPKKADKGLRVYRAHRHHQVLIQWLRENGVATQKPLHTLRKEFGSLICQQAGIHAASRLLRHSGIAVTAKHYLDDNRRIVSGVGELLKRPGDKQSNSA